MKKLTKFQKQIIGIGAVLVVAALCFGAYFIFFDKDSEAKPSFSFTAEELTAIKGLDERATFTFSAEKGKASAEESYMMSLAEGYASVNDKVKVVYGKGDDTCVLSVNGKTVTVDVKTAFKTRKDGTPYSTTVRALFNEAMLGKKIVDEYVALPGYNLYGDMVNSAGLAYVYDPVERKDLKYVYIKNRHDELTFIPLNGTFYLADSIMDLDTSTTATMVAAVRAPVATDVIELKYKDDKEYAELLKTYGLDSEESATAIILIEDNDGNASYIRVGKALTDGTGFYAYCNGKKDRIYVMQQSISNYILIPKESFLIANFGTPLKELTDVFSSITDIEIGVGDEEPIKAVLMTDEDKKNHPINYSWKITAPDRFISGDYDYALPNYGNMGDLLNALCALSSDEVMSAEVNEESLEKYGLKAPYRTYSWLYKGETRCTVYFSNATEDGYIYVYSVKENVKEGTKDTIGISRIKKTAFAYLDYTALDYVDTKLFTQYFDKLDSMSFSRGGVDYTMTFEKDKEGAVTAAKINGRDADLLSCRNFYKNFIHCYVLDEYVTEGEKPKELLKISATIGGKKTEISFGRISNMKAYCLVNGKSEYVMEYDLLETLISNVDALINGEVIK